MHNENIPARAELPSTKMLLRSTILAAFVAGVLLVTAVLPAEYGIDPTGIGRAIGLQQMGEIKISLAKEADASTTVASGEQAAACNAQGTGFAHESGNSSTALARATQPVVELLKHEMEVTLAPNEGTEIKVTMAKGSTVQYSWWTDGGRANFDVHGDSKELNIDYHGYGKGSEQKSEGVLEAAFDGHHGWFWRNRTPETITITLQTSGGYTDIAQMN